MEDQRAHCQDRMLRTKNMTRGYTTSLDFLAKSLHLNENVINLFLAHSPGSDLNAAVGTLVKV